jgi:hypothetical protein
MAEQLKPIKPKITYLPTSSIRYSGSVPSMSRRGGIKLNPLTDGGINPTRDQEQLRVRDMGGNKLVDIIDRATGFCVGTRSVLESGANWPAGQDKPTRPAVSGQPTGQLRNLPAKTLVASSGERVYLDEAGRRIRTTDMHEEPIRPLPANATPDTGGRPAKRPASGTARAAKPAPATRPTAPGTASGNGRITDADVRDYLRALYRKAGKPVPASFSRQHMFDGRLALKAAIEKARKALGGK